ncbi:MAG: D-alanyl-D-alanine carboxypeptidase [Ruminococcaceae bacterium]|nr:D-alanyl-D-alanine carboxypeptidase [Oscillospiraceae bacterium]
MKFLKSICVTLLACCLMLPFSASAAPQVEGVPSVATMEELPCKAAILMDAATGTVLYEQNADEALPPASVTKVMTLLLVMEAVEKGKIALDDMVGVSAHAASMGGSQVFLKEGEQMSVEEMLKCVVIASANDCAVALAEFVAGSEEAFVAAMNARAAELGMKNTRFENTNGLDDTAQNHVISARDIAIMSRELISHPKILEYSGIWMDSIRDGAFGLTNTNRLVRFYPGCTGLKTGSTSRAGFCISATATRDGLSLVCVIMAAETRDVRNACATKLLDYGFANFESYRAPAGSMELALKGSDTDTMTVNWQDFALTVPKGRAGDVEIKREMPDSVCAPLGNGAQIGEMIFLLDGKEVGRVSVCTAHEAERIGFGTLFWHLLSQFLLL